MEPRGVGDAALISDGWTRRFQASEPRLSEAAANYRELGFEVRLEPIDVNACEEGCTACFADNADRLKVIYTRPPRMENR